MNHRRGAGTGRGLLVGAVALGVATGGLLPFRSDIDTATAALLLVVPGVLAGIVGGPLAAAAVAMGATLALNLGFLEPYGQLKVNVLEETIDLLVFLGVALLVGELAAAEGERRVAAERRAAEIEALDRENATIRAERQQLSAETMALGLAAEHRAALLRAVSHDLRTPLSTIRAVASDLRDGTDYDSGTRDELLDLVVDEADRLDRLVANLLNLSRVEAGALQPEQQAIALDELLDQCVRRHARLVRDRKVSIDVPLTLPLIDGDYALIEQAVTNLVANAVRHAPAGSRIIVSAARAGDDQVEVAVADQGPGIPEELRAAVFTPFRRGPGSTSSGVGLAIVRAVVEAHGGTIAIGDTPGGGARIAFTLPMHRA